MSGTKKSWHPTHTRTAWVPIKNLSVDPRYERPLSRRKVVAIAKDLDPDAIGQILVSERDDGSLVIIDGQHRVEAVRETWSDSEAVPCLIYVGLTFTDEADLFVKFNDLRTKPRPLDLFKARIAAKDENAAAISKVCMKNGLTIGAGGGATNRIACVQALAQVYNQTSAEVLDQTLSTIIDAWSEHGTVEASVLQGSIVHGVALVIARHRTRIDLRRLVKAMHGTTHAQLIAKARFAKQADIGASDSRARIETMIAQQLVYLYNKGLRDQTRHLRWDTRFANQFWLDETQLPRTGRASAYDDDGDE